MLACRAGEGRSGCGLAYASEARGFADADAFFRSAYSKKYEAAYLDSAIINKKAEIATETRVPDALRWVPTVETRAPRWLDVGCSQGALLGAAKDQGFEVRGVEFSEATAAAARTRTGAEIRVGPFEDPEVTEGWEESLEVVSAIHVFEHSLEPRAFLRRAYACLVPGGVLMLEVPNAAGTGPEVEASWRDPRHILQFDRRSLEAMVELEGFQITERLGATPEAAKAWGSRLRRSVRPLFWVARWVYRRFLRRRVTASSDSGALVLLARKPAHR